MNYEIEDIESLGLTKQRQAVLRAIRESENHQTAVEVFESARRFLPGISFATVYNSLNYLTKERLIGEVRLGTNAKLYDRKLTRHDHAICNNCGKLVDLELPIPEKLIDKATENSKFQTDSIELTLRGLCSECV